MKKFFEKKNIVSTVLVIAAVVLLIAGFCRYIYAVNHLVSYSFSAEDIAGFTAENTGNFRCTGGIIDSEHDAGLYDIVPDIYQKKGYYKYTVEYTSEDAEGSFLWPHSFAEYFHGQDQKTVLCEDGYHRASNEYWQNMDEKMTLRLYYSGTGKVTVTGYVITETDMYAKKVFFWFCVVSLLFMAAAFVCFYVRRYSVEDSTRMVIISLTVLVLLSSLGALVPFVFYGNDFMFHAARIQGIAEGMQNGQFPVRINPTFYNGYGYADTIMYGNILLYIPAFLMNFGFRLSGAYNAYIVFINLLTVLICYFSVKGILNDKYIAVVATAMYALAPYRMINIYMRSAIGEYSAMAFLPQIVYGLYRIYTDDIKNKNNRFDFIPLVIGITGVIQTHILSVEMVAAFIILTCLIFVKLTVKPARLFKLFSTVGCTFILNLGFIIPFADYYISESMRITKNSASFIQGEGAYLVQMFNLLPQRGWGSLNTFDAIADEMPLNLGLGFAVFILLFVVAISLKKEKTEDKAKMLLLKQVRTVGGVSLVFSVLTIWMSTIYFPWDYFAVRFGIARKIIGAIQFPWRWIEIASVSACVAGACGIYLLRRTKDKNVIGRVVAVAVLLNLITSSSIVLDVIDTHKSYYIDDVYEMDYDTTYAVARGEYTPTAFNDEDSRTFSAPRADESIEISAYGKQGTTITLELTNSGQESGTVILPLLWYKGYSAADEAGVIDKGNVFENSGAEVSLLVPAGYSGRVTVWFEGFWYWRVAEVISLISVLGIIFIGIRTKLLRKNKV